MKEFAALQDMTLMPFAERLGHALTVTALGMGITFIVLIALLFAIKIMSALLKEKKVAPAEPATPAVAPVVQEVPQEDEGELVAVLMAAIVASSGIPYERLKLRSFKEVTEDLSLWSKAGVSETMNREI